MLPQIIIVGGVAYLLKDKIRDFLKPPEHKNPITNQTTPVHPVTGQPVPPGTPPFAQQVAQNGVAVGVAKALHDYLKKTGTADGLDATAQGLVRNFQMAANSDALAVALHGPLPVTGQYDTRTAAALTLYTQDAIPAAVPSIRQDPAPGNYSVPGDASMSAFNLSSYLDKNGNDKSPQLQTLVKQFQVDFNTDPKYGGPASPIKVIATPLAITGVYETMTWTALKVGVPTAKSP